SSVRVYRSQSEGTTLDGCRSVTLLQASRLPNEKIRMPQTIQCAACQRRISIPDNIDRGRQYRCPGCGGPPVIPGGMPEPPVALGAAHLGGAPTYQPPPAGAFDVGVRDTGAGAPPSGEPEGMDADVRQTLSTGTMIQMLAHATYLFGLLLTVILF